MIDEKEKNMESIKGSLGEEKERVKKLQQVGLQVQMLKCGLSESFINILLNMYSSLFQNMCQTI